MIAKGNALLRWLRRGCSKDCMWNQGGEPSKTCPRRRDHGVEMIDRWLVELGYAQAKPDARTEELPGLVAALLVEREEMLALLREHCFTEDGICRDCGKGWRTNDGRTEGCKPDCRLAAFPKPDARTVPK